MLLVFAFVADDPEVLPDVLLEPGADALADGAGAAPIALVSLLVPELAPDVAGVDPGCTMAPPLAPSAPPVVAPAPVTGACADVPALLLPEVDAPALPLVVCAMAPPATNDATRRPSSLD
jgi:hypothetical protein